MVDVALQRPTCAGHQWLHTCNRGKDENAHAVIDTYMDYCAKRWQTREGTYQLKRRRLLPDMRDPARELSDWKDFNHLQPKSAGVFFNRTRVTLGPIHGHS